MGKERFLDDCHTTSTLVRVVHAQADTEFGDACPMVSLVTGVQLQPHLPLTGGASGVLKKANSCYNRWKRRGSERKEKKKEQSPERGGFPYLRVILLNLEVHYYHAHTHTANPLTATPRITNR